ncbi:hypothetical protein DFH08DRAFT_819756 [Mycena albidolilacea]|uniref:Uncharacterized protein n=1 Tax=Mycena albidolilacea TaxID=1033008 RepID=A0AAD7EF52_9AGAR|nr:hypothetical protein DFH08DRAFT_819756 [Mycena albidolilacea]
MILGRLILTLNACSACIGAALGYNDSNLETILTACPRVVNVWVFSPGVSHRTFNRLERLHHLAIQVLSLSAPHPIDFAAALFRYVTHPHFTDSSRTFPPDIGARLVLAPALIHISCDCGYGVGVLPARIRTAAALQCIVVFIFAQRVDSPDPPHTRFVCIEVMQMDSRTNWLQAAATDDDYWALADAFIAAKRAGRVEGLFLTYQPEHMLLVGLASRMSAEINGCPSNAEMSRSLSANTAKKDRRVIDSSVERSRASDGCLVLTNSGVIPGRREYTFARTSSASPLLIRWAATQPKSPYILCWYHLIALNEVVQPYAVPMPQPTDVARGFQQVVDVQELNSSLGAGWTEKDLSKGKMREGRQITQRRG